MLRFTRLVRRIIGLPRRLKQSLMLLSDAVSLLFALWLAYSLRLGHYFFPSYEQALLILCAPFLAFPVFVRMGLYRSVIRYLGEHALWSIVKAMFFATCLWTALAFVTQMTGRYGVPRSVPVLYCLIGLLLVGASRFGTRWLLSYPFRARYLGRRTLIYGAGSAGRQIVSSLRCGHAFSPAAFLDDDARLQGKDIDGLRVYSPEALPTLIERFDVRDIIVTLPSISSARRREIVIFLEQYPLRIRFLPAMSDIADGKNLLSQVREVDVADLLGRDPVPADPELLAQCIVGKVVLVTGAGGSIGSELCRQIIGMRPKKLILLDISEYALFRISHALRRITDVEVDSVLGSVCDVQLMNALFQSSEIETVYHAAAHKHVWLVESNVLEGIRNNILGTLNVVQEAFKASVKHFVLISTDKAVRPTSIMGATKRWAELIIQDFARRSYEANTGQIFCSVRFGNVLGSSGSVVPVFKEQIDAGGPVTVTHSDVTRYFMSIHEAVELVIQAGSLSAGGELFLLDMGEPVKIMDLARNMIRFAGHTIRHGENQDGSIEIVITGLSPGEKLYEELLIESSQVEVTDHPRIMKAREHGNLRKGIFTWLESMHDALEKGDQVAARNLLMAALSDEISKVVRIPIRTDACSNDS